MAVRILTCRHCQAPLKVPEAAPAGKKFRCSKCGGVVSTPPEDLRTAGTTGPADRDTPSKTSPGMAATGPAHPEPRRHHASDEAGEPDEASGTAAAAGPSRIRRGWVIGLGTGAAVVFIAGVVGLIVTRAPRSNGASGSAGDYAVLAELIADPYALDPARPVRSRQAPEEAEAEAAMKTLAHSRNPVVRAAFQRLQAGRERAQAAAARQLQSAQKADEELRAAREKIAGQTYLHEESEMVYDGTRDDGSIRYRRESHFEERQVSSLEEIRALANKMFVAGTPAGAREAAEQAIEEARRATWAEVLPRLGEVYGKVPDGGQLVTLRITRPDPRTCQQAVCAVVNTSGRTLTDVTLAADFVHFMDTPRATGRQVVFLRSWPADQAVYLSPVALIVLTTTAAARPAGTSPRPDNHPELMGVGGVVEARLSAWSAEAHQPELAVHFPEIVTEGARFELAEVSAQTERDVLMCVDRVAVTTNGHRLPLLVPPDLKLSDLKQRVPQPYVLQGAPRVQRLAPDTDLARQAQALLDDPVGIIRDRRQRDLGRLLQASTAGRAWAGEWAFERDGAQQNSSGSSVRELNQVLGQHHGSKGKLALRFEAPPNQDTAAGNRRAPPSPRNQMPAPAPRAQPSLPLGLTQAASGPPRFYPVSARLFNPEHPDAGRVLRGEIAANRDSMQIIFHFVTTRQTARSSPVKGAQPPAAKAARPAPASADFDTAALDLKFRADDKGLRGRAEVVGDPHRSSYHFELELQPADK